MAIGVITIGILDAGSKGRSTPSLLVVKGLSGADDACLKEVDFSSAIHLALHELEFGYLPLCLTI